MDTLKHWIINLRRTRGFHPAWIVLAVLAILLTAAVIWLPASLVAKTGEATNESLPNELSHPPRYWVRSGNVIETGRALIET